MRKHYLLSTILRGCKHKHSDIIQESQSQSGAHFVSRQRAVNLFMPPVTVTSTRSDRLTALCVGDNMDTRYIDSRLRERILKRDGYKCRYCGNEKEPFHIDHVYPHSKGGETSYNNLVTACKKCNLSKHNSVGMWPKPIGYFDNPKKHSVYITLITLFGLVVLINGVITINNGYSLVGSILAVAGMFISFLSITANLLRP